MTIKINKMNNNDLIEKAKKDYPIGTTFKVAHINHEIRTVLSHELHSLSIVERHHDNALHINLLTTNGGCASVYCIDNKGPRWAKVVSYPKIDKPYQILSYRGIHSTVEYHLQENGDYRNDEIGYANLKQFERLYEILSVSNCEGNIFIIGDTICKNNKTMPQIIKGFKVGANGKIMMALTDKLSFNGISIDKIQHNIDTDDSKNNDSSTDSTNDTVEQVEKPKKVLKEGLKFKYSLNPDSKVYTIESIVHNQVRISWEENSAKKISTIYPTLRVQELFDEEKWIEVESSVVVTGSTKDMLHLNRIGISTVNIRLETNLEKAKRLYPIGTIFCNKNLGILTSGANVKVIGESISERHYNREIVLNICSSRPHSLWTLFHSDTWAEIVGYEPQINDKFTILNQYYWDGGRRVSRSDEFIITKFVGSYDNPNSVIHFTRFGNGDYQRKETVLLKNIKIIK